MASSCLCSPSNGSARLLRLCELWQFSRSSTMILWFTDEACRDVRLAGGKGASLAAMTAEGLPVPPGFVIPAYMLEQSVHAERLRELVEVHDYREAQALVQRAEPPREAILVSYERLGGGKVAVRSSACAEDSEA